MRRYLLFAFLLMASRAFAAGGTCPSGSSYISLTNPSVGGGLGSVTLSSLGVTSCYYISAAGLDTNAGTTEGAPWLHAPGMPSCSNTCAGVTPSANTGFIFRGGDTWHRSSGSPATGGAWTFSHSGTAGNPIYWGIDVTWFSGGSFARPIFSQDNALNTSTVASCSFADDATTFLSLGSTSFNIVDGFEFTGNCQSGTGVGSILDPTGATSFVSERLYVHGWTSTAAVSDDAGVKIGTYSNSGSNTSNRHLFDVIDGSDSTFGTSCTTPSCVTSGTASGWAFGDGYDVEYSVIRHVSNGIQAGNPCTLIGNLFEYLFEPTLPGGRHGNVVEGNFGTGCTTMLAYNNVTRNTDEGVNWWMLGGTYYIFNNVWMNSGHFPPDPNGLMLSGLGMTGFTTVHANIYNNTFQANKAQAPAESGTTPGWASGSTITWENNHIMDFTSTPSFFSCGSGNTCTPTENGGEVFQTTTVAEGQGYSFANSWAPTALSNATVSAGLNATTFCNGLPNALAIAACAAGTSGAVSEVSGWGGELAQYPVNTVNARGVSDWDAGAYQFLLSCSAPTYGCALNSTQSGGKAVIQNISPTPNVGNLTGAGTVVSPADFGLPICRVTDSTFDPTIPNATIVANSGGSGDETLFNTNSTLYILGAGGQGYPMSLNFNGVTCTTARLYASNASWTTHGGWYLPTDDPGWSYTNPYLLFLFDGTNPAIDSYNVTGYTPTGTPPSNVVQFDFRHGQTGSWGTTSANGLPSNYVMTWSSYGKQNKATGSLAADQIFGAGVSNAIVIAGVVASGTFTNGETVTQAGTGSTATLHFVHTNLYVDTVTGSPNNSGTWTGGTSGATFTPSASPTAAGQNYGTDAVAYKVGSGVSYLNTLTGVVTGDFGTVGTVGIGDRFTIHNTKLSKDGAWLLISFEFCLSTCTNNVNTPYFWQIGTTNLYPGCVPSNDCSGHYTEGYSHFINDDGSPTLQQISRVYGNNSTPTVIPMGLPWSGSTCTGTNVVDVHQNWTNADTADSYPFFQTTIFATPATASNPYICAGADEVQGINSSTGTVYRFAHTYNTDQNTNFSTASAIGAVSQDGNFALFSSDWKGTLGSTSGGSTCAITSTCRGDVFVVALTGVLSQATPSTCTPGSGTYSSTQTPACTNPNSGTTVQCYTTNGTTPATNGDGATCAIGTSLASGSTVSISTNTTLGIIAGTSTLADSAVTTYTYFIEAIAPTASPTSGSVPQTVTVTDTNTGTHIVCYNTTGSPATNGLGSACAPGSTHYTGPLSVTLPETLYIVAGTSTLVDSTVNSYTYGAVSNVAPAVVMF